jgi:SAM-dependent methyltransferase
MSVTYRILYRLGFTPWEHSEPPEPLAALIEGPQAQPAGAMLDVGCGTGIDAIYVALHGWDVTAIDVVPSVLTRARESARKAGASVRFLRADITRASQAELGGPFSLMLDRGCLHSLTAAQRPSAARQTRSRRPGRCATPTARGTNW